MRVLRILLAVFLPLAVVGAIGVTVLVRRGFRATASPLPFEASLARRMRNFAIPTTERDKKNPFEQTSDSKQQGREYLLGQCGSYHGIDGSGKTQIGHYAH